MVSTLRLGATEADLDERRLRTPAGSLPLTEIEVRLLAFLVTRRGQTVSREELLAQVWTSPRRTESRAVDHAVSRLRKKLEPDPAHPRWLTSTRGGGYRLEAEPSEAPALPEEPSSFVGRAAELDRVMAALRDHGGAVLLGLGGIGKSRVALRAALRWREEGGKALVVNLRHAQGAGEALAAVAVALGVQAAHLQDALAERTELLLVLDEVEQLQDAELAWVGRCAGPRYLLTSQRPVGLLLPALELGPLPLAEGAALVLARASGKVPVADAERLAETLDGVPFALELAARWLSAVPVDQVLARLHQLKGLGEGRHQTVQAALLGCWQGLSHEPRCLLAEAALFAGAFSIVDLEHVCGYPALDLVAELLTRGWLQRAGERLVMYTVIRQFLAQQGAIPEDGALRHARWLLSWAPEASRSFQQRWDPAAEERLSAAVPDLQLALTRLQAPDLALPLLLVRYRRNGRDVPSLAAAIAEVEGWMWRAGPHSPWAAELLLLRARLAFLVGDAPNACRWLEQARAAAEGHRELEAVAAGLLAASLVERVPFEEAEASLARAIVDCEAVGYRRELGRLRLSLSHLLVSRDMRTALATAYQALDDLTAVGDPGSLSNAHAFLSMLNARTSQREASESHYARAETLFREIGDGCGLGRLLNNRAWSLLDTGDIQDIPIAAREAIELLRRLGNRHGVAQAEQALAWVALEEGREAAALELGLRARSEFVRCQSFKFLVHNELLLGYAALALGRPEQAARSFQEAVEACHRVGYDPNPSRGALALAQLCAGDPAGCERLADTLTHRPAEIVAAVLAGSPIADRPGAVAAERALVRAARAIVARRVPSGLATLVLERGSGGQVRLQLDYGGHLVDLGYRRPWAVLWALAQKGLRDQELPEHERGWLELEDLAHRADMEPRQVDTYISRAREALAEAGLAQAADIVVSRRGERRLGWPFERLCLRGQHRPGAGPSG
jgi:DNA-binding winged helix-turn-helix (wHTH) protein/tetratricopeptide (TPR) repeat protein